MLLSTGRGYWKVYALITLRIGFLAVKECHLFASVGAATNPKEALERITCLSHFNGTVNLPLGSMTKTDDAVKMARHRVMVLFE